MVLYTSCHSVVTLRDVVAGFSSYSDCWIIQPATSGYRVEITTAEFELESSSTCLWDSLQIRCGPCTYTPGSCTIDRSS